MSYIGKIPANAVLTTADLADGIVTAAKIEDGTVVAAEIASNAITTAKINANAVTTAKITDANVTQGKIADQAINEAKMQISNAPTNGYLLSAQSGNTGGLTWAAAPAGITEADQWRITTQITNVSSAVTISANWERNDTIFDKIGTGMSQSSGIFTFPSTGIWYVSFNAMATGAASDYISGKIKVTQNNSSYVVRAESYQNTVAAQDWVGISTNAILNIDDATNVKVLFEIDSGTAITYKASTTANYTWATFIRLGDT